MGLIKCSRAPSLVRVYCEKLIFEKWDLSFFFSSVQPCPRSGGILKAHLAFSPSPSWEMIMIPAPLLAAAMGRCGAPHLKATTMTANGASVPLKVCALTKSLSHFIAFLWMVKICQGRPQCQHTLLCSLLRCTIINSVASSYCTQLELRHVNTKWHWFVKPFLRSLISVTRACVCVCVCVCVCLCMHVCVLVPDSRLQSVSGGCTWVWSCFGVGTFPRYKCFDGANLYLHQGTQALQWWHHRHSGALW